MRTFSSTAILLALATTAAIAQTPPPVSPAPTAPSVQTPPPAMPQTTPRAAPGELSGAQTMTTIPADAATVTHWYKQAVYDPSNTRIGEIDDALMNREGKIVALIIGVGGFLGIGEKHVAVPFDVVRVTTKDNNKFYLVMNSTKDALKNAPGFKYDRSTTVWMPEKAPATTGTSVR